MAQDKVYLFDYSSMSWQEGPPIKYARYGHSCGSFHLETSPARWDLTVMVAGGQNPLGHSVSKSVEQINLMRDSGWSIGPKIPVNKIGTGSVMLSHSRKVELIFEGMWLELKCKKEKCFWHPREGMGMYLNMASTSVSGSGTDPEKPGVGRIFSTAIQVSDYMFCPK